MNTVVMDEPTAKASLAKVRTELDEAVAAADKAMAALRDTIIKVRPSGMLDVDEIASAVGHDRNYVDSTWSSFLKTDAGKAFRAVNSGDSDGPRQTRVALDPTITEDRRYTEAYIPLQVASKAQAATANKVVTARAERNRVVAMVYASKILGPSAIAAVVDVDRNHVLRIARKAGVAPQHRAASRNQHSK